MQRTFRHKAGERDDARHVTFSCEQCKKEVTLPGHRYRQSRFHFCSRTCSAQWHQGRPSYPRLNRNMVVCETCGKAFTRRPSHARGKRTFCSKACFYLAVRGA